MKYPITFWCGVPYDFMIHTDTSGHLYAVEERVVEMKQCGFTHINGAYGVEGNKLVLKLCEKHDLKMMVIDERISQTLNNPEKSRDLILSVINDYRDFPALYAYYVKDEPTASDFPTLSDIVGIFRELDPEHEAYINLFPNYANAKQLGTPTYYEHVDKYLDEVRPQSLSYDHYHFLNANRPEERFDFANERDAMIYYSAQKKTARGGFFVNLEIIRELSLKYNTPFMLIILLTEHGPYRYLSEAEIRFEALQALAYGAHATSYFTYWTPKYDNVWKWRNGIIDAAGNQTTHYNDVKRINPGLSAIGGELLNHRSVAVYHVGDETEAVTKFVPHGGIESIVGGNVTAGFFDGGLLLLASKNFEQASDIKITTALPLSRFDIACGKWISLPEASEYTFHIDAGDGVLLSIKG